MIGPSAPDGFVTERAFDALSDQAGDEDVDARRVAAVQVGGAQRVAAGVVPARAVW